MASFETDIHALIEDINGDYGEAQCELRPLVSSRPHSNSDQPQTGPLADPRQRIAPIYSQQPPLYTAQASNPHDTHISGFHDETGLDAYDRVLLAESQPQGRWHTRGGVNAPVAGRLSLPGHTAPFTPTLAGSHVQRRPQLKQRVSPSQNFVSRMAKHMRTPPAQTNTGSSPLSTIHSSPLFAANQRRTVQDLQLPKPNTGMPPASNQIPTDSLQRNAPTRFNKPATRSLPVHHSFLSPSPQRPQVQPRSTLGHAIPVVQGIQLVPLDELPDRLRSVFRHPLFNAIQSKCFTIAYKSSDNLVVSAPTGGGKTAILELAICRLISNFQHGQYKIVYMAPTKSLCSERQRDWQAKFAALDLQCAELTGDTDHGQLRNVQSASIVITTPEKWDSMTRKWKDQAKLMQMVKLFLIDEVHILKETRGAILEALVSRMKSVGSSVRFVALSATVPNSEDIATWLGKDPTNQHIPAPRERFGEEFRPVKLQKHVVGLPYKGNDFGFETACDPQLPSIIAKYSHKKPIMVFCITRKVAMATAKLLANLWATKGPRDRHWEGPKQRIVVQDPELKQTLTSGVAFHHAGLDGPDRVAVEKGFLEGQINVICCTSTLAVGVNLPCHMVIVKNTVSYQDDGIKEYSDLEVMQMLGRAGRPQFDTSAVAVIITKQEKVKRYEKLVSGEELLESCLHLNLIDHLNAEIGLGTIYDLYTAKRWLGGTFLSVRLGQHPEHYKLDGDPIGQNLDDRIEHICKRDLELLEGAKLISCSDRKLKSTESGDAMARYYIKFETMRIFMRLPPRAKLSDILSVVVQADEFHDIRLRAAEKKLYKEINNANGIKFPIKVDLAQNAHKRSLIIQAELGGVDFPGAEAYAKHRKQFNQDKVILFSQIHRLIRCIIDCQIYLQDAVAVRNALELARSFGARVWDNSPYQMKQVAQIGLVAIRKLAMGGINSIESLEAAEPHRIEMLMSRNPPFGSNILADLKAFPKLRVSLKMMGKESRKGRPVIIKIKAECGFMNDKIPTSFHRKPIYVCLLTERSDGHLVDFKKISANKLGNGQDLLMSAELLDRTQHITCYVMCDDIAGTMRSAELKPDLPAFMFPAQSKATQQPTSSRPRSRAEREDFEEHEGSAAHTSPLTLEGDEFGDNDLDDQDMMNVAEEMDFNDIDDFASESRPTKKSLGLKQDACTEQNAWAPEKLDNGKWACNHKCKDKTTCKHLCCRVGVDKAPKAPKGSFVSAASTVEEPSLTTKRKSSASLSEAKSATDFATFKSGHKAEIETVDLVGRHDEYTGNASREFRKLDKLHKSVNKTKPAQLIRHKKPSFDYMNEDLPQITYLSKGPKATESSDKPSTDYGDALMGDLPSPSAFLFEQSREVGSPSHHRSTDYGSDLPSSIRLHIEDNSTDVFAQTFPDYKVEGNSEPVRIDDDEADLEAAMVGLSDSVAMEEIVHALAVTGEAANVQERHSQNSSSLIPSLDTKHLGYSSKTSFAPSKDERLFLSTDSPEKQIGHPQKRTATIAIGGEDKAEAASSSAPLPKKLKANQQGDGVRRFQPLAGMTDTNEAEPLRQAQIAPSPPNIKPDLPAWVHDFDPAFIAEYQDYVDFV